VVVEKHVHAKFQKAKHGGSRVIVVTEEKTNKPTNQPTENTYDAENNTVITAMDSKYEHWRKHCKESLDPLV